MNRARTVSLLLAMALAGSGCSWLLPFDEFGVRADQDSGTQPGMDAAVDGGVDPDAGPDASEEVDSGTDAGRPEDAGPQQITAAEFEDEFFEYVCRRALRCESKLGLVGMVGQMFCHPQLADEIVALGLSFELGPLGRSDDATFNPTSAEACLTALRGLDACVLAFDVLPTACHDVFTGSKAPGEECRTSSECAGYCDRAGEGCPRGTCDARGGEGEPCSLNVECEVGMVCSSGACRTPGGEGAECTLNAHCALTYRCRDGQCGPPLTLGEPCTRAFLIGSDQCGAALVCTRGADDVDRCLTGQSPGQPCNSNVRCAVGHRCAEGSCVALAHQGEPCVSRENCAFGFYCTGEVCAPQPTLGQSCSGLARCIIGGCVDGVCTPLPDGATCQPFDGEGSVRPCAGYCHSETGTCQSTVGLGETCDYDEGVCGADAYCESSMCTTCMPAG